MSQRLDYFALSPKASGKYAEFSTLLTRSPFLAPLAHLVMLRASQINGCAFCVDMHARELRHLGEGWQRLNSLCTWRETALYSERERAALAWAELLTRLPDGHAGHDAAYETLREHFNEQEAVELTWTVAQINTWNRLCVGMHAPVPDKPLV